MPFIEPKRLKMSRRHKHLNFKDILSVSFISNKINSILLIMYKMK